MKYYDKLVPIRCHNSNVEITILVLYLYNWSRNKISGILFEVPYSLLLKFPQAK